MVSAPGTVFRCSSSADASFASERKDMIRQSPSGSTEGRIVGANAGYNDSGLPIREMTRLNPGDQIIPVYTLYMADANSDEELQESEFEGDPITWREGMTVTYEDLADEEEPTIMVFSFIFYDIFGEDTMSEIVSFEI